MVCQQHRLVPIYYGTIIKWELVNPNDEARVAMRPPPSAVAWQMSKTRYAYALRANAPFTARSRVGHAGIEIIKRKENDRQR